MKIGWIKLNRSLRGSFDRNNKRDYEIWSVYVYLAEMAVWEDNAFLTRGQFKSTCANIVKEVPIIEVNQVKVVLAKLVKLNLIKMDRASKYLTDGYIFTVCNYGAINGVITTDDLKSNDLQQQNNNRTITEQQQPIAISLGNIPIHNNSAITVQQQNNNHLIPRKEEKKKIRKNTSSASIENLGGVPLFEFTKDDDPSKNTNSISKPKEPTTEGSLFWRQWSECWKSEYGREPLRNAKDNIHCKMLANVFKDDSQKALKIYFDDKREFYVNTCHSISTLAACANQIIAKMFRKPILVEDRKRL